jgi:glycosyltransferase involved in cell wall biosynthesis
MGKHIGFVSTRFAGNDGVSLEAAKWAEVMTRSGHHCYWFGGELDRDPQVSFKVAEAFFQHPANIAIDTRIFGRKQRSPETTQAIHDLRVTLKQGLYEFIQGISSVIIPNVLDFENPPHLDDRDTREFRRTIGLAPEDYLILQPTRIVQRKGIEHAIDLVQELGNSHFKLIISHEAGEEGFEYAAWLKEHARKQGVDLRLIATRVPGAPERPTLWELYAHADFITYPSLYEGFGNAFLEAVYFKLRRHLDNLMANFFGANHGLPVLLERSR